MVKPEDITTVGVPLATALAFAWWLVGYTQAEEARATRIETRMELIMDKQLITDRYIQDQTALNQQLYAELTDTLKILSDRVIVIETRQESQK